MNLTSLEWYAVPADSLSDVLLRGVGEAYRHGKGVRSIPGPRLDASGDRSISVGVFVGDRPMWSEEYRPPVIAVLPRGNGESDVLAWTSAFMPDFAPLGQYLRVLSYEDWSLLENERDNRRHEVTRTDRWACIALGELLGLTKKTDLKQIDITEHHRCLSTVMGMAAYSGGETSMRTCSDRLRHLYKFPRFTRPRILVDHLTNAWALLNTQDLGHDIVEIVHLVVNAVEDRIRWSPRYSGAGIQHFPELSSDSIEGRVLSFTALLGAIVNLGVTGDDATEACALHLAAAAFLVGRSTSHAFLLQRVPERAMHHALAYFSLFAALSGPEGWDAHWARAVKAIERTIRQPFDVSQPSVADIGWLELTWTLSVSRNSQPFKQMVTRQRGLLSIEVVPGARISAKLIDGTAADEFETSASATKKHNESLQMLLKQIQDVERDIRRMLPGEPSSGDGKALDRPIKRGYRSSIRKNED